MYCVCSRPATCIPSALLHVVPMPAWEQRKLENLSFLWWRVILLLWLLHSNYVDEKFSVGCFATGCTQHYPIWRRSGDDDLANYKRVHATLTLYPIADSIVIVARSGILKHSRCKAAEASHRQPRFYARFFDAHSCDSHVAKTVLNKTLLRRAISKDTQV